MYKLLTSSQKHDPYEILQNLQKNSLIRFIRVGNMIYIPWSRTHNHLCLAKAVGCVESFDDAGVIYRYDDGSYEICDLSDTLGMTQVMPVPRRISIRIITWIILDIYPTAEVYDQIC